ncbi:MAG: hypothetical protein RJA81_1752 [Planctomycetota bacterium]|jgi:carbonic anhydrase
MDSIEKSDLRTRRSWISGSSLSIGAAVGLTGLVQTSSPVTPKAKAAHTDRPQTPAEAFHLLMEGNERFIAWRSGFNMMENASQSGLSICNSDYPENFSDPQDPIAIVLTCSDSRDIPELIFDQGFGDLFVTRTAGNTICPIVLGTIEYSAVELGTKLLMVLGHSGCGAVTSAVESIRTRTTPPGWIRNAVEPILPAARQAIREMPRATVADQVFKAVQNNVNQVRSTIGRQSPTLNQLTRSGNFAVVGAWYDLTSGMVNLIS